jgi:hypothetical protein
MRRRRVARCDAAGMKSLRRPAATLATLALTASLVAGCADEGEPAAVCDDVEALRASVSSLDGLDIREGDDTLTDLSGVLDEIRSDVRTLADDASTEYTDQVDAVQAAASVLRASVDAAALAPTVTTLSAVADDARSLGATFEALGTAVGDTC